MVQQRNYNIERIRVFAMLGIVSFHTHVYFHRMLGLIGLHILMMLYCIFIVNQLSQKNIFEGVGQKAKQLLYPWIAWSLIYAIVKYYKAAVLNIPLSEFFSYTTLIQGTQYHLWFLPYAFMVSVVLYLIGDQSRHFKTTGKILVLMLFSFVMFVIITWILTSYFWPSPFYQWFYVTPSVVFGSTIAFSLHLPSLRNRLIVYFSVVGGFFILGIHSYLMHREIDYCIGYMIAISITMAAFLARGKESRIFSILSSLTYGIYLSHPLLITIVSFYAQIERYPYIMLCMVFTLSALMVQMLKKTPLRTIVP